MIIYSLQTAHSQMTSIKDCQILYTTFAMVFGNDYATEKVSLSNHESVYKLKTHMLIKIEFHTMN